MTRSDFVSNSSSSSFVCATNMDLKTFKKELIKASVLCSDFDRSIGKTGTKKYLKGLAKRNKENLDAYLGKRLLFIGGTKTGFKVEGWKNQLIDECGCMYFGTENIDFDKFKTKKDFFEFVKKNYVQETYCPNGYIDLETIRVTLEMKKRGWIDELDEKGFEYIQQKLNNGEYVYLISYGYSGEGEDSYYIYVNDTEKFFDYLPLEYLSNNDLAT